MIDRLHHLAYRAAYRALRVYWAALHPATHGALVALWHEGKILLVRNSYLPYYSLPGGYVRRGETGREAAARELREETGLTVPAEELTPVLDLRHEWEGKHEHLEVFELAVSAPRPLTLDGREVIEARYVTPEEAMGLDVFPPIRQVIRDRLRRA
jgi:ADP-ribose pyrophosphatase YjhB (NUDIX family)